MEKVEIEFVVDKLVNVVPLAVEGVETAAVVITVVIVLVAFVIAPIVDVDVEVIVDAPVYFFENQNYKINESLIKIALTICSKKIDVHRLRRSATRRTIEAAPIAIANVGTKRHNARATSRTIAWIAVATDCVE